MKRGLFYCTRDEEPYTELQFCGVETSVAIL